MHQNRVLGAAALVLAAIMIAFGYGLEAPFAYEPVGPSTFPLIAAGVIAICGLILVVKPGEAVPVEGPALSRPILALSGCLLAYALLFQPLGFVLSTTLMMIPVAMIFGATWWQGALAGGVLAVSSYLLFDRLLAVVLPAGLLGGIL
jgi:putative tricarboxylic transport membrane protein